MAAPAELNRNCTLPKPSIASCTMSSTAARLVTSMVSASAWPPKFPDLALTCSTVCVTPAPLMSAHTTLAPSRAKISAVARPMPLPAPVMTMVFPEK